MNNKYHKVAKAYKRGSGMLLSAILVMACSPSSDSSDEMVQAEITMPVAVMGVTTRASLTDAELDGTSSPGIISRWTAGDKVAGYALDDATAITLTKSNNTTSTNKEQFTGALLTNNTLRDKVFTFVYPAAKAGTEATMALDFSSQQGGTLKDVTDNMLVAWAKAKCVEMAEYNKYSLSDVNECKHKDVYSSEVAHDPSSNAVVFDNKMSIVRFTFVVDKDDKNADKTAGVTGDGNCLPITNVSKIVITDDSPTPRLLGKVVLDKTTGVVSAATGEQVNTYTLVPNAGKDTFGTPLSYSSVTTNEQNKSWGLALYMAFPCPQRNELATHPSTLTFKPLITVTTTGVDKDGNTVTKDYYCFLKERSLSEGVYYRTTPIHCYEELIHAQLEIAEWLDGGKFDATQDNW